MGPSVKFVLAIIDSISKKKWGLIFFAKLDTKGGGPKASCLWMQKIPIFIFEYFPKIDAFDTFPLFVCFFHLNISSCVNSSAPLCLCHVCYSCVLLHLSLPYHRPGCTTVCVTWPILPVLTFLQVASERRMIGVPGRITWDLVLPLPTFLRGQNPQDVDLRPNIGIWENIWQTSGVCCCDKGIAQMFLWFTRSLGALRAPTSSWRPFGPLDFVLRALSPQAV